MAKYEEYAKNLSIEEEIEDAGTQQEVRTKVDVPDSVRERFDGKSLDDVMASYAELEVAYSKQGQKTGELRKSFDEYVALQSPTPEPEPEPDPVTVDDFYEDAEEAITRVIDKTANKRIEELEAKLARNAHDRQLQDFTNEHKDWDKIVQSPEFIEWVQSKDYRVRLAQKADGYDFEAAEELFGMYDDYQGNRQEVADQVQRDSDLADATLETSSPESPQLEQTFSRTEIVNRKLAAKRGDPEATDWVRVNSSAIEQAYIDGNVTD